MKFITGSVDELKVTDAEISELLHQVYVEGGFTPSEVAKVVFEPKAVKSRGFVIGARDMASNEFAGMIIVIPPTSNAIVRAQESECEIHLLGVKPEFRGCGLGRILVSKAIEFSEKNNWSKIILWTQKPMKAAQNLYESFNFQLKGEMRKNGIEFLVYKRKISV